MFQKVFKGEVLSGLVKSLELIVIIVGGLVDQANENVAFQLLVLTTVGFKALMD